MCASCERVYLRDRVCHKCGFGAFYGAVWMYGGTLRALCRLITQRGYKARRQSPMRGKLQRATRSLFLLTGNRDNVLPVVDPYMLDFDFTPEPTPDPQCDCTGCRDSDETDG